MSSGLVIPPPPSRLWLLQLKENYTKDPNEHENRICIVIQRQFRIWLSLLNWSGRQRKRNNSQNREHFLGTFLPVRTSLKGNRVVCDQENIHCSPCTLCDTNIVL